MIIVLYSRDRLSASAFTVISFIRPDVLVLERVRGVRDTLPIDCASLP